MSISLTCPRGHQWSALAETALPLCPVCGAEAQTTARPSLASTAQPVPPLPESQSSTVAEPLRWYAPPPAEPVLPLPAIEGYRILEEVGRGGMGVVYRAIQQSDARTVAIKVIRKDRLQHAEAVQRFRREAQAAARLAHPNIVLVYDADHEGALHYLVMEYVPGLTLQHLVEKEGPLEVARACDYIRQAALGLQHAHEQALVHRDIKPGNLMVMRIGTAPANAPPMGSELLKILDMGVARLHQLAEKMGESITTLTHSGTVVGTADFIAPEQLEDPHAADGRADLYSLGCTFYYLLTGEVPFPGGTLIQKLDRQRWQSALGVEQLRPEIPSTVAGVVRKLMAKRPEDRYPTAAAVAEVLVELARTGAIAGEPKRTPLRARLTLRGHTDALWSVALAADGSQAYSGGKDRTVRCWDVQTGAELRRFGPQPQEIRVLAAAPAGELLLLASGASVRLLDAQHGDERGRFAGHSDTVRCAVFTPDGRRVLSGADDKTVRLWDAQTGREQLRYAKHRGGITCLALTPDGTQALSAGRDQTLRLWELRNGQDVRSFAVQHGVVHCAAVAPDGRYIVSGHFDTTLRLWDIATGRELRRLQGHKQMVTACLFTPDGRRVLSASQDMTLRLWDLDSGGELCHFEAHTGGVTALALVSNIMASGSVDRTVCLWQLP